MSMLTLNHLLFDHLQFALIHGPNIPGFYSILLFTVSDFTSITYHILNRVLFCFGSISSFFLELFLHSSPVAYWARTDLGNSSFSVLSFCLFILFTGFSRQEYWSGLPVPSPVATFCHHPSWVALHSMTHSFIELRLWFMWSVWLVFCDCGFQSVCPLMDKDKMSYSL